MSNVGATINAVDFNYTTFMLREFFQKQKGFIEVHTQSNLSILAACEDPRTLAQFNYGGAVWPLPQTGQMHLEHEVLRNPQYKGVFCVSTSFRNEPAPIPGRHDLVFPMFEFEQRGSVEDLKKLEAELLEFLGFGNADLFPSDTYTNIANKYGVSELKAEHEAKLYSDYGSVFFLEKFPCYTSPFWNMKLSDADKNVADKIDVILCGAETIGSAERSTNVDEMRDKFYTISDGMYADILFSQFGRDRVEAELNEFLSLRMFPRFGGGIGLTRLIRALKSIHRI